MTNEVSMDEAANTALLLDQHIDLRVAMALANFIFADNDALRHTMEQSVINNKTALAAKDLRRHLIWQIFHDDVFQANLRSVIRQTVLEQTADIQRMVRDEFARGIIRNTYTSNSTG